LPTLAPLGGSIRGNFIAPVPTVEEEREGIKIKKFRRLWAKGNY
jgi:hypothetical protein